MLTTFVLEAQENLLTWFRIFISWLFCNKEEIGCGRKGYCYGTSLCVFTIMTSYTKRCTRKRRFCWSKFKWNPTIFFWVICNLVSLSLIQRQDFSLDFACLFIYSLAIGPELFACLSIYENAETCPLQWTQLFDTGDPVVFLWNIESMRWILIVDYLAEITPPWIKTSAHIPPSFGIAPLESA